MYASSFLRLAVMISALGLAACGTAYGPTPLASGQGCTACHGDPTRAGTSLQQAAPPMDAHGNAARTVVTVGAHQPHLTKGVACATCHTVPAVGDLMHFAAPNATVVFSGNLVGAGGTAVAPWNRDLATCSNYCHSAPGRGGTTPTPLWTSTTPLACGACHWDQQTALTATGLHLYHVRDLPVATRLDCGACHGTGYSAGGVTAATHVDGTLQVLAVVGWQDPRCSGPRTCYATCHAVLDCRNWP